VPNGTPARFVFFSRLSFRRFAKKKPATLADSPALFGSATVRRPFKV